MADVYERTTLRLAATPDDGFEAILGKLLPPLFKDLRTCSAEVRPKVRSSFLGVTRSCVTQRRGQKRTWGRTFQSVTGGNAIAIGKFVSFFVFVEYVCRDPSSLSL